jgi:hypothetical protein
MPTGSVESDPGEAQASKRTGNGSARVHMYLRAYTAKSLIFQQIMRIARPC